MQDLPPSEEEDFSSDAAQWHMWLPIVLKADGSEFFEWSRARQLCEIAERHLRPYFFQSDTIEEEDAILQELEELQERLTQHNGLVKPRRVEAWYQVLAQLKRMQPLVERLLG